MSSFSGHHNNSTKANYTHKPRATKCPRVTYSMRNKQGLKLTLSLLRVINIKIPLQLHKNMTSHSMENLTFHSLLRSNIIILQIITTSLVQLLFERLGEYTF